MVAWSTLFVFTFLCVVTVQCSYSSFFLKPITLPIENEAYIQLMTGNNGKYNKYRLDYNYNETYIYQPSDLYSQTSDGVSEIIYFNTNKIRLTVKYEVPSSDISNVVSIVQHDGIIGLGASSELWLYWNKITLSSIELTLGDYNHYISKPNTYPIITKPWHKIPATVNDKPYNIQFDMTSELSYIPPEIYFLQYFEIVFEDAHNCAETLSNMNMHTSLCSYTEPTLKVFKNEHVITTYTLHNFNMAEVNNNDTSLIILGRTFLNKMIIYKNNMDDTMVIKPSYEKFSPLQSPNLNSYLELVLIVIYIVWQLTINSEINDSEQNNLFFALLQTCGQIFVIFTIAYNVFGIQALRFYKHFLHLDTVVFFYTFIAIILLISIINILFLFRSFLRYTDSMLTITKTPIISRWNDTQLARRFVFETLILITIWFSVLQYHNSVLGYLYLISVSSWLTISQITIASMTFIRRNLYLIPQIIITIFFLFFLVYCNIAPFLRMFHPYHPMYNQIILFYLSFVIIIPSCYIICQIETSRALYRLKYISVSHAQTKQL